MSQQHSESHNNIPTTDNEAQSHSNILEQETIQVIRSNWTVDELTPATMIMVDDDPPILSPTHLDKEESEFLASLQKSGNDDSSSSSSSLSDRDNTEQDIYVDAQEPLSDSCHEEDSLKTLNQFSVGVAFDRNKRFRRTMEDTHHYIYSFLNIPGSGFFAIYDGHAGKGAADFCKSKLHDVFANLVHEHPQDPIPDLLHNTFAQIDQELGKNKNMYAGTTAIVAFTRYEERDSSQKRVLYTANVGDARAVLNRGGNAVRLSYDHKGSDPSESLRIQGKGGFMFNNRVNGVLAVTRSLGDTSMKEWVIGSPFTTETILENQDECLVLACDGLWDVCTDQQAIDLIKSKSNPIESAMTLLNFALENGSTDNLSILVVKFQY